MRLGRSPNGNIVVTFLAMKLLDAHFPPSLKPPTFCGYFIYTALWKTPLYPWRMTIVCTYWHCARFKLHHGYAAVQMNCNLLVFPFRPPLYLSVPYGVLTPKPKQHFKRRIKMKNDGIVPGCRRNRRKKSAQKIKDWIWAFLGLG